MKNLKYFALITCIFLLGNFKVEAQACQIQLHECINSKSPEGNLQSSPGKEVNDFRISEGEHALRMYIKIVMNDDQKINAKNKVQLIVTKIEGGNEVEIHQWAWYTPSKNETLSTDCYFPEGEITLKVVDADNHQQIYATRKIIIKHKPAKVGSGNADFPYDRTKFKIWTCKNIDDNWKPIQPVSKIKVGECIQLFFESQDLIKNLGSMRWGIYRLKSDGSEEYVNQKDQGIGQLDFWRRLSYEECDEFRVAGIYRIYIASKDDADAYFAVNSKNYFAKADLIVE